MQRACRAAILDHVLGKAFTEGTLADLMADLWDHAYWLGYLDGQEDACQGKEASRPASARRGREDA